MISEQLTLAGRSVVQVSPFVKWAGGKSQLLKQFRTLGLLPEGYAQYVEPFVGGGAVFFHVQPSCAIISDLNEELINTYAVIRDQLTDLITELSSHEFTEEYFYSTRARCPSALTPVQRASRFIFLNKTCFNGLYRVNRRGEFNVPFGKHKRPPKLYDHSNLRAVSHLLRNVTILCQSYERTLDAARPGDFVYLDPPYHPMSETANFTSYTDRSFDYQDQVRLAEVYSELDRRGCLVMLSNSDTPAVRKLYSGYEQKRLTALRAINCNGNRRKGIAELAIVNY